MTRTHISFLSCTFLTLQTNVFNVLHLQPVCVEYYVKIASFNLLSPVLCVENGTVFILTAFGKVRYFQILHVVYSMKQTEEHFNHRSKIFAFNVKKKKKRRSI